MEDGKEPISFQAAERFAPIMDKVFEDLKHRLVTYTPSLSLPPCSYEAFIKQEQDLTLSHSQPRSIALLINLDKYVPRRIKE